MMSFSEKLKAARTELGYTQGQLGREAGLCLQSILGYEKNRIRPRPATLIRLAEVLHVSTKYLSDDSCEDPLMGIAEDHCFRQAQKEYHERMRNDVTALVEDCCGLFYREDFSSQQKDAVFVSLQKAYFSNKASRSGNSFCANR